MWTCLLTCLQAFVVVGDSNGHVGLGVKCAKEVATAIRGAIILAKTCACNTILRSCCLLMSIVSQCTVTRSQPAGLLVLDLSIKEPIHCW
jgi:ribosomal protein S5